VSVFLCLCVCLSVCLSVSLSRSVRVCVRVCASDICALFLMGGLQREEYRNPIGALMGLI
jgi:hypothetical protein